MGRWLRRPDGYWATDETDQGGLLTGLALSFALALQLSCGAMWTPIILALIALTLLIAAPFETVGAALGAYFGFLMGHQIGMGAGIAIGIVGFLIGVSWGYELRSKFTLNWSIGLGEAAGLAVVLSVVGALLAFIITNWNVK